ncbi:hypothetical protein WJ63_04825 [Burkholderia pyrrocinia]|nr:hypothetical protein WJ63_04825 [Burkholderia pyrrocinia]
MNQAHGFDVLHADSAVEKLPCLPARRAELDFQLSDELVQISSLGLSEQPALTVVMVDNVAASDITDRPEKLLLGPVYFHNSPFLLDITPGNVPGWRLMKHLHRTCKFLRLLSTAAEQHAQSGVA